MKATIYYSRDGITFPILNNTEINGRSVNGLKRAFINAISKANAGTLALWFGHGSTVTCEAWMSNAPAPLLSCKILTY